MPSLRELIISGVNTGKSLPAIYAETGASIAKPDFYKLVLNLIVTGEIPNVLSGYCGNDCSRCRALHATLCDDAAMRQSVAGFYKSEFNQDIPPERVRCFGCKSDEIMDGCLQCPYMACCKGKGLRQCSDCPEYPCQSLGWYIEKYVNKVPEMMI